MKKNTVYNFFLVINLQFVTRCACVYSLINKIISNTLNLRNWIFLLTRLFPRGVIIINLTIVSSKYRCSRLHSLNELRVNRRDDEHRCHCLGAVAPVMGCSGIVKYKSRFFSLKITSITRARINLFKQIFICILQIKWQVSWWGTSVVCYVCPLCRSRASYIVKLDFRVLAPRLAFRLFSYNYPYLFMYRNISVAHDDTCPDPRELYFAYAYRARGILSMMIIRTARGKTLPLALELYCL